MRPVASLVALLLPPGAALVEALVRCWDDGDAAVILDPSLPPPALDEALAAAAPQVVRSAGGEHRRADGRGIDDGDALVVLTSGTTGLQRAAVVTHAAVDAAAAATSDALSVDPSRDRWLSCLPLHHVGGLGVVTRALRTRTPLEVLDHPSAEAIEAAGRAGATLVSLVPTLLARLDPTAFRVVLVGGAAPPASRPANVVVTWGLTETFGGVVYDGRPLTGVEVRAEAGELLVRTPTAARAWRDGTPVADTDGWMRTGDGGHIDEDGSVHVTGRLAEVIRTGGEMVWPQRLEAVLAAHPAIAEVAVLGLDDPAWGQRVHAVVVAAEPGAPPTLDALRDHVAALLPRFWAPRSMQLVASLPRTALGKVRTTELRSHLAGDDPRD